MKQPDTPAPATPGPAAAAASTVAASAGRVAPHEKPADETIKETFESIIIAFILAFIFRAYVVEAFVIPTGSMAPTLMGQHADVDCQQCGYNFTTDVSNHLTSRSQLATPVVSLCAMCSFPNVIPQDTYVKAGDRILVHKYVYSFSEPRRWDVVVFKAPHQPEINFIKRLVALPGEKLYLLDGNLYVAGPDAPVMDGRRQFEIARKTDAAANHNWQKIQRAVWQPIYHSQYVPLDQGEVPRLRLRQEGHAQRQHPWQTPWVVADEADADHWRIDFERTYEYQGTEPSSIVFDFNRGHHGRAHSIYPYNTAGLHSDHLSGFYSEPIEDIRLAATFLPLNPTLLLELATTARMDREEGIAQLVARLDDTGRLTLEQRPMHGGDDVFETRVLAERDVGRLPPRRATEIELWYVDEEALVFINGRVVLRHRFDVPWQQVLSRSAPRLRPQVSIQVAGTPVYLHRVELDRDIYFGSQQRPHGNHQARGGLIRADDGTVLQHDYVQLQADEFFCIGDNNPQSDDSRYWRVTNSSLQTDPWVTQMIHGGQERAGIVPRRLMIGRAFFVYFPAPYQHNPEKWGILPNFGDMRFIH